MTTINIGGKRVKVSDDFLRLSPEQQNATVDEIARSLGGGAPMAEQPFEPQSAAAKEFAQFASGATQNPAAARYEMLPEWQKPIVAGNDILSSVANGATFGFGDKAVAGARSMFTGKSYEDELAAARSKTQGARNRSGWAGTVGEVAGSVAAPLAAAGKGVTLAGRLGTGAMTGAKGLAARTGLMAAEGSGYGALGAAGNDQDIATGAGIGALAGGAGNVLGEALSGVVGKVAGSFNKAPPRMSAADLKAAGEAAYRKADSAGVIFNKQGIGQMARNIVDDLTNHGYHPNNEPGAKAALDAVLKVANGQSVTLKGLDTIRKMASNGYIPGNRSNNAVISKIISRVDELVDAADPATMFATKNPKAAAEAIKEARSYWHRARKVETVEGLMDRASLNAGSTGSGGNIENATRQQIKRILTNEGMKRGFSKAEQDAARKAVVGSKTQNALRLAGKLSPEGNGLMMTMHAIGGYGTGGATLPLAAAGYGAKKMAESLASKSVNEFVDLVARGGVPAPVVQNALQRLAASKREAISRALMALGVGVNTLNQAPVQ